MSDIEYLAIKEFGGKLVTNTGQQADGGTGNTATLTASSGKDLYLAKAKINIHWENTTTDSRQLCKVELQADEGAGFIIKETAELSLTPQISGQPDSQYEFIVSGIKVAATKIIKLEVTVIDAQTTVEGTITGFEETTGDDPRL